jgi:peptidoglycan/xylan/chitin deacetylase (PgdA/CDA1 family)
VKSIVVLSLIGCAVLASFALTPVLTAGDPSRPEVALTFDDGPNPDATPKLLTELEHAHARATFFVVGKLARAYPRLIARMVRDGDAVESHSWAHEYTVLESPRSFRRSLEGTDAAIEAAGAVHPAYFRPPYGVRAPWTVSLARADGEEVLLWSVPLSGDWDQPGIGPIVQRSMKGVKPGAVIVLHDGNEAKACAGTAACDRRQEIAATPIILRRIRRLGFRCVTIPELFNRNVAPRR